MSRADALGNLVGVMSEVRAALPEELAARLDDAWATVLGSWCSAVAELASSGPATNTAPDLKERFEESLVEVPGRLHTLGRAVAWLRGRAVAQGLLEPPPTSPDDDQQPPATPALPEPPAVGATFVPWLDGLVQDGRLSVPAAGIVATAALELVSSVVGHFRLAGIDPRQPAAAEGGPVRERLATELTRLREVLATNFLHYLIEQNEGRLAASPPSPLNPEVVARSIMNPN